MESSPRYPEAAVTRVAKLWMELRTWLRRHNARLGLFFRVTASALLSFELAPWLDLRLPLWAVLTALIVTQMSVGRSGHHRLSYRQQLAARFTEALLAFWSAMTAKSRCLRGLLSQWARLL